MEEELNIDTWLINNPAPTVEYAMVYDPESGQGLSIGPSHAFESEKYKIFYSEDGINRNYFPDFVINNKYIIECKPKKLWNTKKNKLKFDYAKKFCEEKNYIFKIKDLPKIKKTQLLSLIDSNLVTLTNKWKDKI